jgi:hypothetical protein
MRFGYPGSVRNKLLAVVLLTTLVALLVALVAMIGYDLRVYHRCRGSDVATQAVLMAGRAPRRLRSTMRARSRRRLKNGRSRRPW